MRGVFLMSEVPLYGTGARLHTLHVEVPPLGPFRDDRPGLDLSRVPAERERPFERPCGSTSPQSAIKSQFSCLGFVLALAGIRRRSSNHGSSK